MQLGAISILQVHHYFSCKALDLFNPVWPAWGHELQREVIDTDLAVCREGFHQLLGSAAQDTFVLWNRLARKLNRSAAREEYLPGVTSSFGGHAQDAIITCPQFTGCDLHKVGEPRVTIFRSTPLGMDAFSPDPDGDAWLLDWFGIEGQVLETVELAMVACVLLRPQPRDDLELLIGHSSPVLE